MRTVYDDMMERPGFAESADLINSFIDTVEQAETGFGIWGINLEEEGKLNKIDDDFPVCANTLEIFTDEPRQLDVVEGIAVAFAGLEGVIYRIPGYGVTMTSNEIPVLPTPTIRIGEETETPGEFLDIVDEQIDPFWKVPILTA